MGSRPCAATADKIRAVALRFGANGPQVEVARSRNSATTVKADVALHDRLGLARQISFIGGNTCDKF